MRFAGNTVAAIQLAMDHFLPRESSLHPGHWNSRTHVSSSESPMT